MSPKLQWLMDNHSEEQIRISLASYYAKALLNAGSEEKANKFANILGWLKRPVYSNKPRLELIHIVYNATKGKVSP